MQESSTISDESELEKNIQPFKKREESKIVLLQFDEFGKASGIMMIINMVSNTA